MQPFRTFRALGLSFRVWFTNFVPFTLLAAVLYSPVLLWLVALDDQRIESTGATMTEYFTGPTCCATALSTLLAPMLTYRVIQGLNGVRVSLLASIKLGVRGIVPAALFAVIIQLARSIPLAPLGAVVQVVAICFWFVAIPAAVAERVGPLAAFSRSTQLTAERRDGILWLAVAISLGEIGSLQLWSAWMSGTNGGSVAAILRQWKHAELSFVIAMGVTQLFAGIVQAVSYVLLREDKDGGARQELARIFE